ncbi:glycosyltransferase [candidate division KSB1 bacterium]|nr:glycosyltransferase [candidate division KSB1 bacterium]
MKQQSKRVVILIPSFNEEKNLASVLERMETVGDSIGRFGWESDVLVINDGSADQTEKVARHAGVKVLSLPVNLGYGAALQAGFKVANNSNYAAAISIDADGQHQPEDIVQLLQEFDKNEAEVVLGSRFVVDTGYQTNIFRKIGITLFSFVLYILSGKKIADVTTGFQVVSRKVVALFADEYPHDYPDTQVLLLLSLMGFKIREIPVTVKQRLHGTSMHSSIKSLVYPVRIFLAILVTLLRTAQIKQSLHEKREELNFS